MSCRPFFFFQAEDGIRDWSVTGVQTCALPIYSGHGGDGPQNCPAQVSVYDVYNLTQFCSTCSFTCIPINYDSTFTPSGCAPNTVGVVGSGNVSLTVSELGNFAATDCNWHYLQIKTTVTNAHG